MEAAKLYDLNVLVKNIHDNPLNYTRFIIISKKQHIDRACNKISLIIILRHEPGSLYKIVEQFAKNEFNMLKIQSRPIMAKPFEYMFYIDFEGNLSDKKTNKMLENLEKHCADFKIIGNYKAGIFNHIL